MTSISLLNPNLNYKKVGVSKLKKANRPIILNIENIIGKAIIKRHVLFVMSLGSWGNRNPNAKENNNESRTNKTNNTPVIPEKKYLY